MRYRTPEEAEKAARDAVVNSDDFITFEGHNCDEEAGCSGWDGESRRCACTNRRVYWHVSGDEIKGYIAEAVAY